MNTNKTAHGGRREGSGRRPRNEPKAKPIWCGQISDQERQEIMTTLTPEERRQALLQAVVAKKAQR